MVLEEVDNFHKHEHFPVICSAMHAAGFECLWKGSTQLAEVSATFRRRFFVIWQHSSQKESLGKLVPSVWMALGNPSLEKIQAIFPVLPQQLLQPCFPIAEAMCMYMDPALAPPTRSGRPPLPPAHTRIIEPSQQAGCVMAAYHYQHLLPPSSSEEGAPGLFFSSPQEVRFLSSPEVASLHGACDLVLIPRDDREAIRILGNSLSVQQATAAFVLAMQPFAEFCSCLSPADAVQLCHTHRLHASNSLLVEVDQGWLLCHQRHIWRIMQRVNIRTQVSSRLLDSSHEFLPLQIVAGHGKSEVQIVFHVSSHINCPKLRAISTCDLMPKRVTVRRATAELFAPGPWRYLWFSPQGPQEQMRHASIC